MEIQRILDLPHDVIDQIAAGEVVERPSHMVKELVENSLDAGATEITVEYSEGGRSVTVSDNGIGIHEEDLSLALRRHATSKISESQDLWNLSSFGFRGEALASIASVSKLKLSSKQKNSQSGNRIESHFGELHPKAQVGHEPGTKIQVSDLFENIPARLKFLKSPSAEYTQIKSVLKALALSNPQVSFRILQDQNLFAYWPKSESKLERAKLVLEVDELYAGEAAREGVRAYSIFASPHQTAKTTRQIWMFAQKRWVQDRSIQAAILEAYRNLLMHGEYPIVATWVELDPAHVDVNIHPTKSQVKFLDPSLVFRAVQASIRETLEKAPWIPKQSVLLAESSEARPQQTRPEYTMQFQDREFLRTQFQVKDLSSLRVEAEELKGEPSVSKNAPSERPQYWSRLQVLGQAHLTYLICQDETGIVIVDQHAAHERVMFEKLMSSYRGENLEVQNFLFPLVVDLSADRIEALEKNKEGLQRLGIDFESMGPESIGIKSAPLILKDQAIVTAVTKFAHELSEQGGSFRLEKAIGDICATMACHSAIRAGQSLSLEEMKSLLFQMDEFPLSSFCPHGRTVSVLYPLYELEKDFGRIV